MALPKKFTNPWADNGGDITPDFTTAKRDVGFVGGDIPAIEDFNILIRENQLSINDIIDGSPVPWYPDASNINKMICSGQWDEPWGNGGDALNVIAGGATKEYRDMVTYFDSNNKPYLLVLNNADTTIDVYDPRATLANLSTPIITTNALTDDLETGGTEVYECISMCTDGATVFIVFTDTNAAPNEHWIQAWTIDITSADWVPAWSAVSTTGTQLTGTGNGFVASAKDAEVIVANATHVAVSCGWVTITAAGDPAIQLYSIATGALEDDGAGDCSTGSTLRPTEGIASDGTNIFFSTGDNAGGNTKLASATLADLTAGCGGAGFPSSSYSTFANYEKMKLCSGGTLIISDAITSNTPANTDLAIGCFSSIGAVRDPIYRGQNSQAAPIKGDAHFMDWDGARAMAFDGQNFWVLTVVDNTAGDEQRALLRIDAAKFTIPATNSPKNLEAVCSVYIVDPTTEEPANDTERAYSSITFDSRDIWCIVEPRASETSSGNIFRLPKAQQRS